MSGVEAGSPWWPNPALAAETKLMSEEEGLNLGTVHATFFFFKQLNFLIYFKMITQLRPRSARELLWS